MQLGTAEVKAQKHVSITALKLMIIQAIHACQEQLAIGQQRGEAQFIKRQILPILYTLQSFTFNSSQASNIKEIIPQLLGFCRNVKKLLESEPCTVQHQIAFTLNSLTDIVDPRPEQPLLKMSLERQGTTAKLAELKEGLKTVLTDAIADMNTVPTINPELAKDRTIYAQMLGILCTDPDSMEPKPVPEKESMILAQAQSTLQSSTGFSQYFENISNHEFKVALRLLYKMVYCMPNVSDEMISSINDLVNQSNPAASQSYSTPVRSAKKPTKQTKLKKGAVRHALFDEAEASGSRDKQLYRVQLEIILSLIELESGKKPLFSTHDYFQNFNGNPLLKQALQELLSACLMQMPFQYCLTLCARVLMHDNEGIISKELHNIFLINSRNLLPLVITNNILVVKGEMKIDSGQASYYLLLSLYSCLIQHKDLLLYGNAPVILRDIEHLPAKWKDSISNSSFEGYLTDLFAKLLSACPYEQLLQSITPVIATGNTDREFKTLLKQLGEINSAFEMIQLSSKSEEDASPLSANIMKCLGQQGTLQIRFGQYQGSNEIFQDDLVFVRDFLRLRAAALCNSDDVLVELFRLYTNHAELIQTNFSGSGLFDELKTILLEALQQRGMHFSRNKLMITPFADAIAFTAEGQLQRISAAIQLPEGKFTSAKVALDKLLFMFNLETDNRPINKCFQFEFSSDSVAEYLNFNIADNTVMRWEVRGICKTLNITLSPEFFDAAAHTPEVLLVLNNMALALGDISSNVIHIYNLFISHRYWDSKAEQAPVQNLTIMSPMRNVPAITPRQYHLMQRPLDLAAEQHTIQLLPIALYPSLAKIVLIANSFDNSQRYEFYDAEDALLGTAIPAQRGNSYFCYARDEEEHFAVANLVDQQYHYFRNQQALGCSFVEQDTIVAMAEDQRLAILQISSGHHFGAGKSKAGYQVTCLVDDVSSVLGHVKIQAAAKAEAQLAKKLEASLSEAQDSAVDAALQQAKLKHAEELIAAVKAAESRVRKELTTQHAAELEEAVATAKQSTQHELKDQHAVEKQSAVAEAIATTTEKLHAQHEQQTEQAVAEAVAATTKQLQAQHAQETEQAVAKAVTTTTEKLQAQHAQQTEQAIAEAIATTTKQLQLQHAQETEQAVAKAIATTTEQLQAQHAQETKQAVAKAVTMTTEQLQAQHGKEIIDAKLGTVGELQAKHKQQLSAAIEQAKLTATQDLEETHRLKLEQAILETKRATKAELGATHAIELERAVTKARDTAIQETQAQQSQALEQAVTEAVESAVTALKAEHSVELASAVAQAKVATTEELTTLHAQELELAVAQTKEATTKKLEASHAQQLELAVAQTRELTTKELEARHAQELEQAVADAKSHVEPTIDVQLGHSPSREQPPQSSVFSEPVNEDPHQALLGAGQARDRGRGRGRDRSRFHGEDQRRREISYQASGGKDQGVSPQQGAVNADEPSKQSCCIIT